MKIREDKKNLIISFDYDPALITILGNFNGRKYNAKTKEWSVPKIHILEVLDSLLSLGFEIDDKIKEEYVYAIKRKKKIAKLLASEFNEAENTAFKNINLPLFNFQKVGAGFLCATKSALLGDEPGLGKSIQTLATTSIKKAKKVLIFCPSSLKLSWSEEIEKWMPDKKRLVISGEKKQRYLLWSDNDAEYTIANYELLIRDIDLIKKTKWDFIIADEATRLSNPVAKQSKLIKTIDATCKIALTGTPLNNKVEDLWNILDFCLPGLLGNYWNFTEKYCTKEKFRIRSVKDGRGRIVTKIVGYKNLSELKRFIACNMLRRRKIDVLKELPEKIYENVYIELKEEEKKVYDAIKKEISKELEEYEINKVLEDKYLSNVVVKMVRLKQAVDSLELISNHKMSSKLDTLKELLKDIMHNESKAVIFTQFVGMSNILERELSEYEPLLITGEVCNEDRQKNVNLFQEENNHKLMIMTEAGAYGLNLQRASYIIHYDLPWSISKMEQREGRCHRIGQKNAVTIYSMIATDTIDEYVHKVLMKKQKLSQEILGDKEKVKKVKMTKTDIKNILSQ